MSVLMVIVDDLRASLDGGPDGANLLQLPHLDALAKRGVAFARAYAQCALCAPSRSSALVGVRPDTTRVLDLTTHFRAAMPSAVTLPQAFKVLACQRVGADAGLCL
jgi:iduronate 2-sulfatase